MSKSHRRYTYKITSWRNTGVRAGYDPETGDCVEFTLQIPQSNATFTLRAIHKESEGARALYRVPGEGDGVVVVVYKDTLTSPVTRDPKMETSHGKV